MVLREQCMICGLDTIPRRIWGFYVGSPQRLKIWECRECNALWSERALPSAETTKFFFKNFWYANLLCYQMQLSELIFLKICWIWDSDGPLNPSETAPCAAPDRL